MIIGISAAVASLAFVVLVCYLITLIQSAKRALAGTNDTLARIQEELEAVGKQNVSLMAAGEKLIKEANETLHSLDPISRSVKQTGEAWEQVTSSVKQVTASVKEVSAAVSRTAAGFGQTVENNQSRLSEIVDYATVGVQLWQKWQSHKKAKSQANTQIQSMEE